MYKDKETERAAKRKWYNKNLEANRARNRNSKREQRVRRREEINAAARARYQANAACEAKKQNDRRRARCPYIGVRAAIRDCERGTLSVVELVERVRENFASCFRQDDSVRRVGKGFRRI